jgi:hypothetical protein
VDKNLLFLLTVCHTLGPNLVLRNLSRFIFHIEDSTIEVKLQHLVAGSELGPLCHGHVDGRFNTHRFRNEASFLPNLFVECIDFFVEIARNLMRQDIVGDPHKRSVEKRIDFVPNSLS